MRAYAWLQAVHRGVTPLSTEAHLASQPTLSRLIALLSTPANRRVLHEAITELAGRRFRGLRGGHRQRYLTIDMDSLPIEVHGHQPGSAWNGHYHQRMYHPLVASIAETGDLLDARLREGNAHTAEGALDFILDLVDRAEETLCQVALVRIDAGFPSDPLLSGLERRGTPYVARLRTNKVLDRMAQPFLDGRQDGLRQNRERGSTVRSTWKSGVRHYGTGRWRFLECRAGRRAGSLWSSRKLISDA